MPSGWVFGSNAYRISPNSETTWCGIVCVKKIGCIRLKVWMLEYGDENISENNVLTNMHYVTVNYHLT